MISVIYVSFKEQSDFIKIFSIISALFIGFDVLYSLFNSLIKKEDLLYYNTSFLSHTEGFIAFTCIAFLLYSLKNKKKSV